MHAIAGRITELDLADLSMMTEVADDDSAGYTGTLGLARLVILSGTEPYLTRTRARFEVILSARTDPEMADVMVAYGVRFYAMARDVIARWYDGHPDAVRLVDERSVMVMTFISGVMTSYVHGQPIVTEADQLDAMIRHILRI